MKKKITRMVDYSGDGSHIDLPGILEEANILTGACWKDIKSGMVIAVDTTNDGFMVDFISGGLKWTQILILADLIKSRAIRALDDG